MRPLLVNTAFMDRRPLYDSVAMLEVQKSE